MTGFPAWYVSCTGNYILSRKENPAAPMSPTYSEPYLHIREVKSNVEFFARKPPIELEQEFHLPLN